MQASVIYRDSTQGTTSMSTHISKKHTGEEPPINIKAKRSAEASQSESQSKKICTTQSSLPVVRQKQTQDA